MKKIILVIVLLLCTACFDYQEINETFIVNGIGIDYQDNSYILNYEIVKTPNVGNDKEEESYILTDYGNTITEAMNKIEKKSSKKISLSHLDIVIISENLAKNGINNIKDAFFRNNKITTNFYILLANNTTPLEILENENKNYMTNSLEIKKILQENNISIHEQADYLISDIIDNKKDITIPSISLNDGIILKNQAVFYQDKFSYYLNDLDTKLFDLLDNFGKNKLIETSSAIINLERINKDIKLENNKYKIILNINATLKELKNNNIKFSEIEDEATNLIQKEYEDFFNKVLKQKEDIIGFKNINYITNSNKDYNNISKEFDLVIHLNLKSEGYVYK